MVTTFFSVIEGNNVVSLFSISIMPWLNFFFSNDLHRIPPCYVFEAEVVFSCLRFRLIKAQIVATPCYLTEPASLALYLIHDCMKKT